MRGVILAGGLGSRLSPLTRTLGLVFAILRHRALAEVQLGRFHDFRDGLVRCSVSIFVCR